MKPGLSFTRATPASTVPWENGWPMMGVNENGICRFDYSTDHENWQVLGKEFRASKDRWIGAKLVLFCINPNLEEGKAFADVDWFRVLEWK
jgi:hypothetical protein